MFNTNERKVKNNLI